MKISKWPFKTCKSSLVLILGVCALPEMAKAQLRWEKSVQEFDAPQSQRVVTAEYPFTNIGKTPVRIRSVRTNCGCTAARLSKEIYLPGESDAVAVAFNIESRLGDQTKRISISTDERTSDVDLLLKGKVREGMKVRPLMLRWKADDRAEWKSAVITLPPGATDPVEAIMEEASAFETRIVEVLAGQKYEVHIRPLRGFAGRSVARIRSGTLAGDGIKVHLITE
jgi:hypothetical protein